MIGPVEPVLQFIDINHRRISLSNQNEIIAIAVDIVAPYRRTWKDVEEGRNLALYCRLVALVELYKETKHSSRIKVTLDRLEKFPGVECGCSFDPGVQRIGRNDVERIMRRHQVMTRIVIEHLSAAIVE